MPPFSALGLCPDVEGVHVQYWKFALTILVKRILSAYIDTTLTLIKAHLIDLNPYMYYDSALVYQSNAYCM